MDAEMGLRSEDVERWLERRPAELESSSGAVGRLRPGAVVGEWKIMVFLGAGLSAEVYRVTNVRMSCEGALKLLVNEANGLKERFVEEADAMRYLHLPSLPRFLGSGAHDGALYYVMEYLEPVEACASPREAARLMREIAAAVHALHGAGYIHRDLKPGNVMRRRNGEVVLIDLGLVKKRGQGVVDPVVRHGAICSIVDGRPVGVGTPGYAAPEQLYNGEASVQSDVFALGKLLKYYCGDRLPRNLRTTFRRATRHLPSDRFPTAKAFAASIRRRHRFAVCACALACALAAAAVAYPVWKPVLAETARRVLDPPEKVLGRLSQKENENDADYFWRIGPLAAAGDVEAQIALAEAYFYGRGTAVDRAEAVVWFRKAAEAGDPGAQASLGLCAFRGWGCEKDFSVAVKWYEKAAAAGNLGAMNDLAFCFLNGFGVAKNPAAGFEWAMKAAERGHHPSQTMVAECYLDGIGVEKSVERAETWLYRAARLGNKRARTLLRTR
jgi:TPR repeat protein